MEKEVKNKGRVLLKIGRSEQKKGGSRKEQIRWGNIRRCRR